MEIRVIHAVFNSPGDIRPKGYTHKDAQGNYDHCPECIDGIIFWDLELNHTGCTRCNYVKEESINQFFHLPE